MADRRRVTGRIRVHLEWARSQGLARLIEEDELHPLRRIRHSTQRWNFRRHHPIAPGSAVPVYLLGVQRSGTNMLARGFAGIPEFQIYNENHKAAFAEFRLRPLETVAGLVEQCRHPWVLFKPLCDSHRAIDLLELGTGAPGRVLWMHRQVDDRARSALAKFGDANKKALARIAAGDVAGLWQAEGLSPENRSLIESFDFDQMSPASAAALFWYVRNSLFFELGLDRRADALAVSYDHLIRAPDRVIREVCEFLGLGWRPQMTAHIEPRGPGQAPPLDIDPAIRSRCDALQAELNRLRPPDRPV